MKKTKHEQRQLTGRWYLKKCLFGRYKVMVEVKKKKWGNDFYNIKGYNYKEIMVYEQAIETDLIELNILCFKLIKIFETN